MNVSEPIRVVVARPGKPATIEMLVPNLAGWRSVTDGGPFGILNIDSERGLYMYYCDEALIRTPPLPINMRVAPDTDVYGEGILRGSVVGFKSTPQGQEISLTEEEAADVQRMFIEAMRATMHEEAMRRSPALALGLGLFGGAVPRNPFIKSKAMPPDNGRGQ